MEELDIGAFPAVDAGDKGRCELQIQIDKIIQCELLAANLMPLVMVIALDIWPVVTV